MDLFTFKSLLFLLSFIGCCVGQEILPEGPVDAILGRNVTLKTLVDKPVYAFIIWNFNDGKDQIHVVTVSSSELRVNAPFKGRVSINRTNGYLTLGPLKSDDSGDYSINIISDDGSTKSAEIKLRVLAPTTSATPTSASPEPTKQYTGCCAGQEILPEGPVDAILGRNVTLKTLVDKPVYAFIIWNFYDGKDQIHVATVSSSALRVNAPFKGRVSINRTNGYLTLGPLKWNDSGDYSINIISDDGSTKTAEIKLRVLAPTTSATPTSASPEPTKQYTDYFVPLVVCVVVIVVLLAGYLLLLYKWMKNRNFRTSNDRNMELSVTHENRAPVSTCEDSTYQSLNPASRDQDQIYSSLTDTRY